MSGLANRNLRSNIKHALSYALSLARLSYWSGTELMRTALMRTSLSRRAQSRKRSLASGLAEGEQLIAAKVELAWIAFGSVWGENNKFAQQCDREHSSVPMQSNAMQSCAGIV